MANKEPDESNAEQNQTTDATKTPTKKLDKLALLNSLVGIIPDEGQTIESAREERLSRQ